MARAVLLVALLIGCGRIGFDARDGGTDAPLPVGRWQSVAQGTASACGITTTGELWCWGLGFAGQLGIGERRGSALPTRVGTEQDWAQVSVGFEHTCAVKTGGALWCWGANTFGALGVGVLNQRYDIPQEVSAGSRWKQVAAGDNYACAIAADDQLWCWGDGGQGQLGESSTVDQPRPILVPLGGNPTWSTVAVGGATTCAVRTTGALYCWGANDEGEIGDGTTVQRTIPTAILPGTSWVSVDVGSQHSCAIDTTGDSWCWGRNYEGQVGDGTLARAVSPTKIAAFTQVVTGSFHSCGFTALGEVWCWGEGSRGRIAGVDAVHVETPERVTAPVARQLAAGGATTCVIDGDAHLFCTGSNGAGQTGTAPGEAQVLTRADARTDWAEVFAQSTHACAIAADRTVWCWGRGHAGQVGDGANLDRQAPVATGVTADRIALGELSTFAVEGSQARVWGYDHLADQFFDTPSPLAPGRGYAAGTDHGCVVNAAGTASCIGENDFGQLGNNSTTASTTPVTVGGPTWSVVTAGNHVTCGIEATGVAYCWGDGAQTGTNSPGNVLQPTALAGITQVTQLELGSNFGCLITGAGALWCWGANLNGQVGDGTSLDRRAAVQIAPGTVWRDVDAGDLHACAIASDGSLWCWGHADQGQLGVPPVLDRVVPMRVGTDTDWKDVACGGHFTCAIRTDGTRWCAGTNMVGELGDGRSWLSGFTVAP